MLVHWPLTLDQVKQVKEKVGPHRNGLINDGRNRWLSFDWLWLLIKGVWGCWASLQPPWKDLSWLNLSEVIGSCFWLWAWRGMWIWWIDVCWGWTQNEWSPASLSIPSRDTAFPLRLSQAPATPSLESFDHLLRMCTRQVICLHKPQGKN